MEANRLYDAIVRGDDKLFEDRISTGGINQIVPDVQGDTLLHLAVMHGATLIAEKILQRCSPLLLIQNTRGDTSLHLAARCGHLQVADVLLQHARHQKKKNFNNFLQVAQVLIQQYRHNKKYNVYQALLKQAKHQMKNDVLHELLRMKNQDGDTALHDAVRSGCFEMVELIIHEERTLAGYSNLERDSPLFIATDKNFTDIALRLLQITGCTYMGRDGMNALHAAIINENTVLARHMYNLPIVKEGDWSRRTPLHYAAFLGKIEMVELFMSSDDSLIYQKDKSGMSAIHFAAIAGHVEIVELLIRQQPFTPRLLDIHGRNAFHLAVIYGHIRLVESLLSPQMFGNLVNQRDAYGDTALHLAAEMGHVQIILLLADDPNVNKRIQNKCCKTTWDMIESSSKIKLEDKEKIKGKFVIRSLASLARRITLPVEEVKSDNSRDFYLVAATIIATATFAAGLTMPGGYIQSGQDGQGMAVLSKRTAFRVFVVTNAAAFGLATAAMYDLFVTSIPSKHGRFGDRKYEYLSNAHTLNCLATSAFFMAFASGMYVTLRDSPGLALAAIVTSVISFEYSSFWIRRKGHLVWPPTFPLYQFFIRSGPNPSSIKIGVAKLEKYF